MKTESLKRNALDIIDCAIKKSDPYESTLEALKTLKIPSCGKLFVFGIGKAAVPMAKAAADFFESRIDRGLVITKYNHAKNFSAKNFEVLEAAHPVSDKNSVLAAEKALALAEKLGENDTAIVLLSGGGSALFEKSTVPLETQQSITEKLLARGAEIDEINAIRRSISLVKGGKFAEKIYPAKVVTLALSDVLSNNKSVIASGITVPDSLGANEVKAIASRYLPEYKELFSSLSIKKENAPINDGGFVFVGDINSLCSAAEKRAKQLGFFVEESFRNLTGEARDTAQKLLSLVKEKSGKRAYVFGGETTVTLKGNGLGGRNQEAALAAAIQLCGKENIVFACAGSDGTDGPTDAAGGIADGQTFFKIQNAGLDPKAELENNNSYNALKAADALIVTGPTGTNVNDLTIILTDF